MWKWLEYFSFHMLFNSTVISSSCIQLPAHIQTIRQRWTLQNLSGVSCVIIMRGNCKKKSSTYGSHPSIKQAQYSFSIGLNGMLLTFPSCICIPTPICNKVYDTCRSTSPVESCLAAYKTISKKLFVYRICKVFISSLRGRFVFLIRFIHSCVCENTTVLFRFQGFITSQLSVRSAKQLVLLAFAGRVRNVLILICAQHVTWMTNTATTIHSTEPIHTLLGGKFLA